MFWRRLLYLNFLTIMIDPFVLPIPLIVPIINQNKTSILRSGCLILELEHLHMYIYIYIYIKYTYAAYTPMTFPKTTLFLAWKNTPKRIFPQLFVTPPTPRFSWRAADPRHEFHSAAPGFCWLQTVNIKKWRGKKSVFSQSFFPLKKDKKMCEVCFLKEITLKLETTHLWFRFGILNRNTGWKLQVMEFPKNHLSRAELLQLLKRRWLFSVRSTAILGGILELMIFAQRKTHIAPVARE